MPTVPAVHSRFLLLVLAFTSACALPFQSRESTQPFVQPDAAGTRAEARTTPILARDVQKVEGATALDAVRQLRPEFLRATTRRINASLDAKPVSVFENGRYIGGIEALENIPLALLVEIRRIEPVEAMILFGSTCPCESGVILVRTQP